MAVFCSECGAKQEAADPKFCRECGKVIKRGVPPKSTTPLANTESSSTKGTATTQSCATCGCSDYKADAFRTNKCINCTHNHTQRPTSSNTSSTNNNNNAPAPTTLTHAIKPKPKDTSKDEKTRAATAPVNASSSSSSSSSPYAANSVSSAGSPGKFSRRCEVSGCKRWVFENGKCKLHYSGGTGAKTKQKFSTMMDQMKKSASVGTAKLGELFKREERESKDDSAEPKGHVKYENMVDAEDVIPFLTLGFRQVLCQQGSDNPLPPVAADDYEVKQLHALDLNDKEFNFLDYAPGFFNSFRKLFGITPEVYIRSLVLDGINGGKLGAGKSGMLFFYSNDKRFVVKTLTREEVAFFRHILPQYDKFVRGNIHTLIPRFFGMYKITMPDKKLRVIVMNNLFDCPGLRLSEKYDLKGSVRNRYVDVEKDPELAKGVLKDMNFADRKIHLGPQRDIVLQQLRIDTEFLMEMNIMDQSLLLGIHQEADSNNEASRYVPIPSSLPAKLGKMKNREDRPDLYNVFQLQGGVRGWDAANNRYSNVVYVFGVIDILQMFNAHKRLESVYKSARYGKAEISAIDSKSYGQRFLEYMEAHTT